MAALTHNTLPFWTKTGNKELFKDQPLTQVGLLTVTLDPRPSWPQLLLPNMKSFPFSVGTKTEAPESVELEDVVQSDTSVQGWVLCKNVLFSLNLFHGKQKKTSLCLLIQLSAH